MLSQDQCSRMVAFLPWRPTNVAHGSCLHFKCTTASCYSTFLVRVETSLVCALGLERYRRNTNSVASRKSSHCQELFRPKPFCHDNTIIHIMIMMIFDQNICSVVPRFSSGLIPEILELVFTTNSKLSEQTSLKSLKDKANVESVFCHRMALLWCCVSPSRQ